MEDIGGLIGRARRAARQVRGLKMDVHAASASFFLILSLFPTLALLLGLLRYTRFTADHLVSLVELWLPAALVPEAEVLIQSLYHSSPALVGLSAFTALWSASRGVRGLLTGLRAVYGLGEGRGWLRTRALGLVYTFAFLLVLLATLVLHVFGTGLLDFLQGRATGFWAFLLRLIDLRFFLLLALQTGLFTALFAALPHRRCRVGDALPGAFLASIGWTVYSHLFSIYVENFSGYQSLYGGVYALALSMLWLYFCIYILFWGGLLNRYLAEKP